jgi:hypothetical protein
VGTNTLGTIQQAAEIFRKTGSARFQHAHVD